MSLEQQMRKHVEKWRGSGLSRSDYAGEVGLAVHKLKYWIRKLEQEKPGGKFLPIGRSAEKIEIELKNGAVVKIPVDVSNESLKRIVELCRC